MSIIVNESLAKGVAKRCIRERDEFVTNRLNLSFSKFKPAARRRGPVYRAILKAFHWALKNEIIDQQYEDQGTKKECCVIFYWDKVDESLGIVGAYIIRKKPMDFDIYKFLYVSRHAVERVYERLNSIEMDVVIKELSVCYMAVMTLITSDIDSANVIRSILIPTEHGLAIFDRKDNSLWTVTTWVSHSMFDNDQLRYFEEHRTNRTFAIKMKQSNSNILLTRTFNIG